MTNRSKNIGTAGETAVVRFLRTAGFPHAERRALHGSVDLGDIVGTPGIVWEVKSGDAARRASDGQVAAWLAETETERANAGADVGVLVMQRAGVGPANAGRWWAIMPAGQLAPLLMELPDVVGWLTSDGPVVRLHLADVAALLVANGYGTKAVA